MKWRRRGTGWPTPNPGASFSSDCSSKDHPGAEGDWFAYKLNDWIGGTPAEMMRKKYEFELEQKQQQEIEREQNMAAKKAKKAARANKKATKASKKVRTMVKKPSKARQDFNERARREMEAAQVVAVNPTTAPTSTTTSGARSKADGEALDSDMRAAVLRDTEAAAVPGTVLAQLHAHLKFAHEALAEWETTYAADLAIETKKVEDEYRQAGTTALREMHSMAFDVGVKQGIEAAQNDALKEIAEMFGAKVESTPEQYFAFLQAQVKLRDAQRTGPSPSAGAADSEVEKLKTKVFDLEEAKKVVAEQCKIAEKEREVALKAAKAARVSEDEMKKARDEAKAQLTAAVAAHQKDLNEFSNADKAKDDASALVAAAEDQALKDIATMFGGSFTDSAQAFAFLQAKAANGHG